MKNKIYLLFITGLVVTLSSCEKEIDFSKEWYKKVIYVLSDANYIYSYIHSMETEESVGYVTVYAGGTKPIDVNTTVTFVEDDSMFHAYNKSNFDIDTVNFAKLLPKENYTIPEYSVELKKDAKDPYALLPIKIRPEGLSPDSTYFINLRINKVSNYEINPKKRDVLYKVEIENKYASVSRRSMYTMRATIVREGQKDSTSISFATRLFPLSRSRVRMAAGNNLSSHINADELLNHINNVSIVLDVKEDNSIEILPYQNIQVEKITQSGVESNYYTVEEYTGRHYKVFYLTYRYRIPSSENQNGTFNYTPWQFVKQRLSLEFNPLEE